MGKRKQALIDSDSSSGSESDLESELLSLSKKRKAGANNVAAVNKNNKNYSDSDSDWAGNKNGASGRKRKVTKKVNKSSSSESESDSEDDAEEEEEENNIEPPTKKASPPQPEFNEKTFMKTPDEEPEEGEVSDSDESSSGSDSSSSSDSQFDDGYDENLMGDEEDRARLNALSEKERETEIFKRIERRDVMRTRWEIERKLKLAKRGEKAKDKPQRDKKKKDKRKKEKKKPVAKILSPEPSPIKIPPKEKSPSPPKQIVPAPIIEQNEVIVEEQSSPEKKDSDGATNEYFDPKERSKERKKNVEANRTDDKRSNAMAMLKAKREGKAKREEEEAKRQAEREREEEKEELEGVTSGSKSADKIKVSDIYSDDSGSSSSSEDEEEKRTGSGKQSGDSSQKSSSESEDDEKTEKKSPFIKTKEELNKLRISRYKMERFINLPIFEKTVLNSFVRISIGNNNQRPVYRAAEVVGVVETAKIYQLGKLRTNRGLKLKHGSQERVFRLEFISNQDFTDSEFDKWREMCEKSNVSLPTIDQIEQKQKDIKFAMNYEYSDEDVNKIIEERNRFRKNPTNYAMKKTILMKERDAALLRGENELAHDLSVQIDQLESRASELDKRRAGGSINLISYINNRNRKKNVEHAEKAIREEILANKGQRIEDPFTRRLTQPRMTFSSAAEKDKTPALQPQPPPPPGRRKHDDDKKRNSVEYNLYSLHDFEIDLDVPLPVNTVNVMPKPVSKPPEAAPKRSLNLEDYKKKRGLI
ncbi:RNA polymerase-associated protein Rtf1 [Condylostylus longicornis]|uniref:RNA polymerase-associated protein Rtf1 n=1 Tax=Condylostylus longicornis TaxID=2530218 RepID=UPI00244DA1A7|nr:RNA polymerase-associated protein Rtf1 [Condylostylus longicornis]